jgi:hypothetical protein
MLRSDTPRTDLMSSSLVLEPHVVLFLTSVHQTSYSGS